MAYPVERSHQRLRTEISTVDLKDLHRLIPGQQGAFGKLDGGRSRAEQVNLIMQKWKWEGTSLCSALKPIWRLLAGL